MIKRWVPQGLLLGFFVMLLGSSCKEGGTVSKPDAPNTEERATVEIGILKMISHPQLDMIERTFIQELGRLGYEDGENTVIERRDAHGEILTAQAMAKYYVDSKKDLIVALTTPCAQAVAKLTSEIPIVFIAVTDPVGAGIVDALAQPGRNVTGVSDYFPVERQMDLITDLAPGTRRIGIPYDPGQDGAVLTLKRVDAYAADKQLTIVKVPVANSAEVFTAARSLVGRCDAMYTVSDITVATAYEAVVRVCEEARIPFFVSAEDGVERGAIATLGLDYQRSARDAASLAKRLLDGEAPAAIPVVVYSEGLLYLNKSAAARMGVALPPEILRKAAKVYE